MTHALWRALSASRLLVACGSLVDRDLGDDEGSLSGLHRGTDASVEPIRDSRLGHGAGLRQ